MGKDKIDNQACRRMVIIASESGIAINRFSQQDFDIFAQLMFLNNKTSPILLLTNQHQLHLIKTNLNPYAERYYVVDNLYNVNIAGNHYRNYNR